MIQFRKIRKIFIFFLLLFLLPLGDATPVTRLRPGPHVMEIQYDSAE